MSAARARSLSPSPSPSPSLKRLRLLTLTLTLSTLTLNTLASYLFTRIPNEKPYHLPSNFRLYLQLVDLLALVGVGGVIWEKPLAISLFSTTLLLDAIFLLIPRLLTFLIYLQPIPETICSVTRTEIHAFVVANTITHTNTNTVTDSTNVLASLNSPPSSSISLPNPPSPFPLSSTHPHTLLQHTQHFKTQNLLQTWTSTWTPQACQSVVKGLQLTLLAGVVAAVVLQVLGAMYARRYGIGLERREEVGVERGECRKLKRELGKVGNVWGGSDVEKV